MKKRESRTMEDPTRNVDGGQLRRELRRAAAWAALALAALVVIYYVLLVPFMEPLDPRASKQTETSYKNRALDVCYTLPKGWEFVGEEQLETITQQILGGGQWRERRTVDDGPQAGELPERATPMHRRLSKSKAGQRKPADRA